MLMEHLCLQIKVWYRITVEQNWMLAKINYVKNKRNLMDVKLISFRVYQAKLCNLKCVKRASSCDSAIVGQCYTAHPANKVIDTKSKSIKIKNSIFYKVKKITVINNIQNIIII